MWKKWFKKTLPQTNTLKKDPSLKVFSKYHYVWEFDCSKVARGTAVGLFVAFIPLPLQMLIAAFLSVLCRANLPIAVAMTWITNPFTFIPINYFIFLIGRSITGENSKELTLPEFSWHYDNFEEFWNSVINNIFVLGKSYFVGLPLVAITASLLGYLIVRISFFIANKFFNKKIS